jgi:hypothetical protein
MSRARTLIAASLAGLIAALLCLAPAAQAQDAPPTPEAAACLACHENLYYLHDTGKWHCLCAATPTCVHCHAGQPGALDPDQAHAGLVANPLQNDAAICRQCHCDDCQEKVDRFLAIAGGSVTGGQGRVFPTPDPRPTAPPPGLLAYRLPGRIRQPWRLAALALTGLAMLALGAYGLHRGWGAPRKPSSPGAVP